MSETRALLSLWQTLAPGDGALATVVSLQGSGYRRPGARLLIAKDGRMAGGVSGGCLETDVALHARRVIADGRPKLLTYDATGPEDEVFGLGLGCNGVVKVLVEPVSNPGCRAWLAAIAHAQAGGATARQAICLDRAGLGTRVVLRDGEELYADRASAELLARLRRQARTRAAARFNDATYTEVAEAPPALWICGAGLDAPAMAELAMAQGYNVTVLDHRPGYARPERFPAAVRVLVALPGQLPPELAGQAPLAALVMTHQVAADRGWLASLLPLPAAYVGLLGARTRAEGLLESLRAEALLPPGWPPQLYAPMGLDIGAETPQEIALAALAEVRAVASRRQGSSLRERQAPIHPREEAACSR